MNPTEIEAALRLAVDAGYGDIADVIRSLAAECERLRGERDRANERLESLIAEVASLAASVGSDHDCRSYESDLRAIADRATNP